VTAAVLVLAGCQHQPTLEEARALCTKQGGFLVVFYTQKVTLAGVGPPVASPGNCVLPDKFNMAPPASAPPASGASVSSTGAPASGNPAAPAN
jgi:hypothetical protein